MKKYIITVFIMIAIFLTGCTPGVFYQIANMSEEIIEISFSLSEDLMLQGDIQNVSVVLKPGERHTIRMSAQAAYNRNDPGIKRDFIDINSFISFFKTIEIRVQSTDKLIELSKFSQESIMYEHPHSSSIIYILTVK